MSKLANSDVLERIKELEKEIFELDRQVQESDNFIKPFLFESLSYAKEMKESYERLLEFRKVGRKPIGVTKKVSITLEDDLWEVIKNENNNISAYFRELVHSDLGSKLFKNKNNVDS